MAILQSLRKEHEQLEEKSIILEKKSEILLSRQPPPQLFRAQQLAVGSAGEQQEGALNFAEATCSQLDVV